MARSAAAELDGLRACCRAAIHAVTDGGARLVLLGAGPRSRSFDAQARGSLAAVGVDVEYALGAADGGAPPELPLSLTVGAWLVHDALGPRGDVIGFSVADGFAASDAAVELQARTADENVALLVLADGSARRSVTAPGYLDPRAAAFDGTVAAALRSGDGAALQAVDADLGHALLAGGMAAWHAAGALLAQARYDAELRYDEAPYGVGYFVASWTARA